MIPFRYLIKARNRAAVRLLGTAAPNPSRGAASPKPLSSSKYGAAAAALLAATAAGGAIALAESKKVDSKYRKLPKQKYPSPETPPIHPKESHHSDLNNPPPRPDLPTIPLEEVEQHNDEESMWYTFRGGVYDLTFFINGHPGGTPRLLMAAGQDLEPYWEVYRQHLRGHVVQWMEKYRIGNLSEEDAKKAVKGITFGDMFETDPIRDPNNLACTEKPFCGEPRIDLLTENYITPNELFYVRNHLAVPDIDPDEYVLIVKGKGIKKHKFTLEDLKTKFPKYEVVTTLQCAGNRREDLHNNEHQIFIAPHWVVGAISNAKWGGVKIRDVLQYCGMDVDAMSLGKLEDPKIKHLQFESYDTDETGFCYGNSIPIESAVDALGEAMFAFEMNDEPLPRDHGFPVRVIAPGHVGNCQAKWLHKVIVSDKESSKPWKQKSYRGFAPDINFEEDLSHWPPKRLDQAPIALFQPVTSLVCNPPQNSLMGAKDLSEITVKGVAWSGGGRGIERVDVSIDGGKSWTAAELYKPVEQKMNRQWAWTQFSKTLKLPEEVRERLARGEQVSLDITSKAMNSDFNLQPETMEPYWNARGVCINHWYHVKTKLDPNREPNNIQHDNSEIEFANTPSGGKFAQPWDAHGFTTDPKHQTNPRARIEPEASHF